MANVQQLTAGLDNLNGIAGDYNIFQLTPATLQATDTVTGGAASPFVDNLEVTATGTLAAAQFQGVTGIEQLILSSAGNDVTLTNGLVAGTSTGNFRVEGGAGDDIATQAPSPTSRRFPSSPAPATTASRAAMAAVIRSSPRTPSHRPTRWLAGPRSTSSTSSRPAPSRSTPSPMCRRSRVSSSIRAATASR